MFSALIHAATVKIHAFTVDYHFFAVRFGCSLDAPCFFDASSASALRVFATDALKEESLLCFLSSADLFFVSAASLFCL